jgi:hypothetical protein
MNNWLQSLTESYKQISIQKELENLIEQIHKEEPTLNENEIKELILNELKMPSAAQLDKVAQKSRDRAIYGRGLMGKIKAFFGSVIKPPKGHPTPDTAYYAARGTKPGDLDVGGTSQETRDSLRKLRSMPGGEASGVVADIERGDRASALADVVRARAAGIRPEPERLSRIREIGKRERQLRTRERMGIPPEGNPNAGDVTKPVVQDSPTTAPKTRKPRKSK